jgi:hypothetical protein
MKSAYNSGSAAWPVVGLILSVILVFGGAFTLYYTKGQSITVQDFLRLRKLPVLT